MQKVIPLKRSKIDYSRKHNLSVEEIRESPIFTNLNDEEIDKVKEIFLEISHILLKTFENQDIELELKRNQCHIATGQLIELESFKRNAA